MPNEQGLEGESGCAMIPPPAGSHRLQALASTGTLHGGKRALFGAGPTPQTEMDGTTSPSPLCWVLKE